ncbi:MAG: winged helix-turn-helix transcriptional regulator [Devosia sp.]|nr:winged helix-turn-helix transcriptional regulator [Devosia sp.]
MTATIQRMERDDLVTRKANPDDGRSALIVLAAVGCDRIADMDRALDALNELLLEQFTTAKRGQFMELLGRVVSVLEVQAGRVNKVPVGTVIFEPDAADGQERRPENHRPDIQTVLLARTHD